MRRKEECGPQPTSLPEVNADAAVGRVLGEAFFLFTAIASFVGGLLGRLLVMKKRVLQCSVCNAVVSAS